MTLLLAFIQIFLAETDYDTSAPAGSAAGMAGGLFGLVVGIVMIAAVWKIFSKAGQPGWSSLIPIYNLFVWCKVIGRPAWWALLLLVCFPIFYIVLCIDLAKCFGKGTGFAIGLIFLGIIFFPILGFGSAQYQGPAIGGPNARLQAAS